jgi:hypothetical protein
VSHLPRFREQIEAGNEDRIQPLQDIRAYYQHHLISLLKGRNDLLQDVAEIVYSPPAGDGPPHPGRVCTGIDYREQLDTYCFEISIQAASPDCIVRDDESIPQNEFEDRTLYVPLEDISRKYNQYIQGAFDSLTRTQHSLISHERVEWLVGNESRLTGKINRDIEAGRHDRIWTNWEQGDSQIQVIKNALSAADDEDIALGEPLTASDIFGAIETYEPEHSWEEDHLSKFLNVLSTGKILGNRTDRSDIEIQKNPGEPNQYIITDTARDVEPVTATHPEDLFELPCFEAMREHLHESGPTRKDLWNFVRTAWWLESYHNERPPDTILDQDFMDDIHDTFDQWEWYDPEKTEYQTRYEIEQGDIDGNIPRPRNCDHEDMQRYCIGQDVCPHSIYGSLPFHPSMFDFLEDSSEPGLSDVV